jgi:hypothetical protein
VPTPAELLEHAPTLPATTHICITEEIGLTSFGAEPARQIVNDFLADGQAGVAARRGAAEVER